MANISIDDLAGAITEALAEYNEEVTEGVKKAVDQVAKEVNDEIKNHISFNNRTGKYIKAFRTKTAYEDKYNKRKTWYVANGQHVLTHLLEHGHVKRGGGRVKAYPHIKYGEELAKERMKELVKEAVKR